MSDWRFQRPPNLPLPQPTEEAQPFFDNLKEGRLTLQHCPTCNAYSHPPQAVCWSCHGSDFQWKEASGKGHVHSYVVTHQAVHPAFAEHTPLATVEVTLAEGPRITSNLVDVPPEEIVIWMPVTLVLEEVAEGVVLPLFRRDDLAPAAPDQRRAT